MSRKTPDPNSQPENGAPSDVSALPDKASLPGSQHVAASTIEAAFKLVQESADSAVETAVYQFIKQSDDSTESPAPTQDVMIEAFLRLGKSIAPGGETALTARTFAETLARLLRMIGENEAFQEQFEALLEKSKSGTLSDTEREDYESFCLMDDSFSGFLRQLHIRSATE